MPARSSIFISIQGLGVLNPSFAQMLRVNDGSSLLAEVVAVAVSSVGGRCSDGSRRAVRWALENLLPNADRFVLIHVMPVITSIPTPSGKHISIKEMDADVVAMFVQDLKLKSEENFLPLKKLCKTIEMETLVLEDDNPATALLRYVSESGAKSLILGSSSSNFIMRRQKGPDVPATVLKSAPCTCNIYVVSRHKVIKKLVAPCTAGIIVTERSKGDMTCTKTELREGSSGTNEVSKLCAHSEGLMVNNILETSSQIDLNSLHSQTITYGNIVINSGYEGHQEISSQILGKGIQAVCPVEHDLQAPFMNTMQSEVKDEIARLRMELQTTLFMYNQACDELVYTREKVQVLSSECLEDARRVNAALEREEALKKIAAEEKAKYLEAMKEVEVARQLLAKEAHERHVADMNACKESLERQKIVDALFSSDKRYRRYTMGEIEMATDFFSEAKIIGEGGYGKVYQCSLDHIPVAIKVLQPDACDKKDEFLREVEVLCQLRHPHIVSLLGACPENGCLVYEYMGNGSLEEHLFCRNNRKSLPWFIRFRIVFEVACGLAFLHSSKPEPVVHRDLKPGNILIDKNYVSKIGDVGLAKLISDVVPDNVTEYRDSVLAGTLCYMDPEYQRTGTIRPKSDLYALGIITLQLLVGRHPHGLLMAVEKAMNKGSFADILDKSVTDWPLAESEELARIALKCSRLRCRDRPDLETEVLPDLKKLWSIANAHVKLQSSNAYTVSHFFCPILQEVMDDPHIAADGFSYEYIAIKAWLERHNVSPVTRLRLQHTRLTPNRILRSAIQDWKSQEASSAS